MAEQKHTEFAMKALSMADFFRVAIGEKTVGQETKYRVELATPDGPSTGGGKQATQHINMIPVAGGPTLVAGSANQVEKQAELRSWDYFVWMFEQRFNDQLPPIEREQYEDLLKRLHGFFQNQGLLVKMMDRPAQLEEPVAPKSNAILIVVLVIAVVAIGVLAMALFRRT